MKTKKMALKEVLMTKKQLEVIIDSFDIEPTLKTGNWHNITDNDEQFLSEKKLDIKNCFFMAGIFLNHSILEYSKKEYGKKKTKLFAS